MSEQAEIPNPNGPPIVFASYSWEARDHRQWVLAFASDLRRSGVDVIFDHWDAGPGTDLTLFMEQSIRRAERVILVCTPAYARKANTAQGGVGYERMVVTGELARDITSEKFIPVLRDGDPTDSIPHFLSTKYFVDFRKDDEYEQKIEELVRTLHNAPRYPKPKLGANPFTNTGEELTNLKPSLVHLDTDKGFSTEEAYARAEILLRNKDILGWRRLDRSCRTQIYKHLSQWRLDAQHLHGEQWKESRLEPIDIVAPAIVLSLSAVESGIPDLSDQRALLDDILDPPGWQQHGPSAMVAVPAALGYVYHSILGAFLASLGKTVEMRSLLTARVRDPGLRDYHSWELWRVSSLIGWIEAFDGKCQTSWQILRSLYGTSPWLHHFFPIQEQYDECLASYYIYASLLELAEYTRQHPDTHLDATQWRPDVPPMFTSLGKSVVSKALTRAIPSSHELDAVASAYSTTAAKLRERWPAWWQQWGNWHRRFDFRSGYWRGEPPALP